MIAVKDDTASDDGISCMIAAIGTFVRYLTLWVALFILAAPCTPMVFVWSNLTDGEPNFTLTQVALNDAIMVFAFAPIVGLLLGLSSITVPWTNDAVPILSCR